MSKIRFAACICRRILQKLLHDSRLFLCIAAVAVLLICRYTQELRYFCGQLQVNVSPLPVFVALTNRLYLYRLLLFLFLMCMIAIGLHSLYAPWLNWACLKMIVPFVRRMPSRALNLWLYLCILHPMRRTMFSFRMCR